MTISLPVRWSKSPTEGDECTFSTRQLFFFQSHCQNRRSTLAATGRAGLNTRVRVTADSVAVVLQNESTTLYRAVYPQHRARSWSTSTHASET